MASVGVPGEAADPEEGYLSCALGKQLAMAQELLASMTNVQTMAVCIELKNAKLVLENQQMSEQLKDLRKLMTMTTTTKASLGSCDVSSPLSHDDTEGASTSPKCSQSGGTAPSSEDSRARQGRRPSALCVGALQEGRKLESKACLESGGLVGSLGAPGDLSTLGDAVLGSALVASLPRPSASRVVECADKGRRGRSRERSSQGRGAGHCEEAGGADGWLNRCPCPAGNGAEDVGDEGNTQPPPDRSDAGHEAVAPAVGHVAAPGGEVGRSCASGGDTEEAAGEACASSPCPADGKELSGLRRVRRSQLQSERRGDLHFDVRADSEQTPRVRADDSELPVPAADAQLAPPAGKDMTTSEQAMLTHATLMEGPTLLTHATLMEGPTSAERPPLNEECGASLKHHEQSARGEALDVRKPPAACVQRALEKLMCSISRIEKQLACRCSDEKSQERHGMRLDSIQNSVDQIWAALMNPDALSTRSSFSPGRDTADQFAMLLDDQMGLIPTPGSSPIAGGRQPFGSVGSGRKKRRRGGASSSDWEDATSGAGGLDLEERSTVQSKRTASSTPRRLQARPSSSIDPRNANSFSSLGGGTGSLFSAAPAADEDRTPAADEEQTSSASLLLPGSVFGRRYLDADDLENGEQGAREDDVSFDTDRDSTSRSYDPNGAGTGSKFSVIMFSETGSMRPNLQRSVTDEVVIQQHLADSGDQSPISRSPQYSSKVSKVSSSNFYNPWESNPRGVFTDALRYKEKMRGQLAKPKYNVHDFYWGDGCIQWIAKHRNFHRVTLAVIAGDLVFIAADADRSTPRALLTHEKFYYIGDNISCSLFILELGIRFLAFEDKRNCLKDMWFTIDLALTSIQIFEMWIIRYILSQIDIDEGWAPLIFKAARLLRLPRMGRLAKIVQHIPELMILVKGMRIAMRSVGLTLMLLLVFVYVFAITFRHLTDQQHVGAEYFSSVPSAMLTLALPALLLPDLADVMKEIVDEHWSYGVIFLVFLLITSVTVMNMLIGLLCDVVNVVTTVEKEELLVAHMEGRMRGLFVSEEGNQLESLSKQEFQIMLASENAPMLLNEMGVDVPGLVEFADYIYQGSNDELTFSEFMAIILELRGTNTATVKHVIDCQRYVHVELKNQMGNFTEKIDAALEDIGKLFEPKPEEEKKTFKLKKLLAKRHANLLARRKQKALSNAESPEA